ncbi:MAG: hypothetical protein RXQ22_08305 [Sulfolobus sp.]
MTILKFTYNVYKLHGLSKTVGDGKILYRPNGEKADAKVFLHVKRTRVTR